MKPNRKTMAVAIALLIIAIVVIYYYILMPSVYIELTGIKKELPAATGQLGFHYGSDHVTGLYQISEVNSNDR